MKKTIIIKSQVDFDALPANFDVFAEIRIEAPKEIKIEVNRTFENSSVSIHGNSSVIAYGNSSVIAYDNSSVRAYDNSSVRTFDNSSVRTFENSSVIAFGNSSVRAYGNSSIRVVSKYVSILTLNDYAICNVIDVPLKIEPNEKSITSHIIYTPKATYNLNSLLNQYPENLLDKETIKLFKSVNPETLCDFYTGTIKYAINEEVICPDFDDNKERECGGGLHLSPLPELALLYNDGKILECSVKLDDIVVYDENLRKVRCKKVFVLGEYKKDVVE